MTFDEIVTLLSDQFGSEIILETSPASVQPSISVPAESIAQVSRFLFEHPSLYFDFLACITAIDNGSVVNTLEVIYHLTSIPYGHNLVLRVTTARNNTDEPLPSIPSVSTIWKTADWHEREAYDLVGIRFEGHPDLRRILLPADWEGHPLRKDYTVQEVYHGIRVNYEDRDQPDS